MTDVDLRDFLRARDVDGGDVAWLPGGEKNDNLLVHCADGWRFVARVYRFSSGTEVRYELEASEFLASQGFPVPRPIRAVGGSLWTPVADRPAALFEFAAGEHPAELPGDIGLGVKAAALAASMHVLTSGRTFGGSRNPDRDPLHRICAFLDGPYAGIEALSPGCVSMPKA